MENKANWRPISMPLLSLAVTTFVFASACATGNRKPPEELSQEIPQSSWTIDESDPRFEDSQYRTVRASKKSFQARAKKKKPTQSSVARGM